MSKPMAEGRRARAQRLALNMANLLRTSTYNCFYLLDVNTESDSDLSFAGINNPFPVALCANYVQAFSLDTVLFCGALNPNLACGLVQIVNVLKRFVRPLRLFNHLRFAVDRIGVDRTIRRSCQCSGNRGSPGRRPVQKGEKGENGCASGLRQLRCKINQATEPD